MRFKFLAILLALALPGTAQNIKIEQYALPNGLRVVLNEDHSAPLVAVNVWYHVGSKNEKPGRTGFAHLFEHMLFSGSEHVGNNEHRMRVQGVGGQFNGSTSFDRTNYYQTVPSHHLPTMLWLEADRMGFFLPALDQKKFDIQREVVKEERRMRYENVPYGIWIESLLKHAFAPGYPYHWPTIGSMADLNAAQLEDVREFFRTWYNPNNAVLTVAGDFDPAETKALIEKYFGEIPRGPETQRFTAAPPPIDGEKREVIPSAVQLDRVYRAYLLPGHGHPDWEAADLLMTVLSGNKAARFDKSLVYEKQIAQDVVAFVFPTMNTGMAVIWATAKPRVDPAKLEAEIDAELHRIATSGVSPEELRRALNQFETGYAQEISLISSRADRLSEAVVKFGDANELNRWMDRYRKITPDDLKRVAAQYFDTKNRVTVLFTPAQKGTN